MSREAQAAIVTGASRGIGKQIALRLARNRVNLMLAARTMEPGQSRWPGSLAETVAQVRELGVEATAIQCDVTSRKQVEELCRRGLEQYGRIDILVNNALYLGPGNYNHFLDTSQDTWDKNFDANLMAAVIASRFCLPGMLANKRGVILNLTSRAATIPAMTPGVLGIGAPYAVSKAALNRFVAALALETREARVAVIALDPGSVLTERADQEISRGKSRSTVERAPMDIPAAAAEYLCCICLNPLQYTGQIVDADTLTRELNLR